MPLLADRGLSIENQLFGTRVEVGYVITGVPTEPTGDLIESPRELGRRRAFEWPSCRPGQ